MTVFLASESVKSPSMSHACRFRGEDQDQAPMALSMSGGGRAASGVAITGTDATGGELQSVRADNMAEAL